MFVLFAIAVVVLSTPSLNTPYPDKIIAVNEEFDYRLDMNHFSESIGKLSLSVDKKPGFVVSKAEGIEKLNHYYTLTYPIAFFFQETKAYVIEDNTPGGMEDLNPFVSFKVVNMESPYSPKLIGSIILPQNKSITKVGLTVRENIAVVNGYPCYLLDVGVGQPSVLAYFSCHQTPYMLLDQLVIGSRGRYLYQTGNTNNWTTCFVYVYDLSASTPFVVTSFPIHHDAVAGCSVTDPVASGGTSLHIQNDVLFTVFSVFGIDYFAAINVSDVHNLSIIYKEYLTILDSGSCPYITGLLYEGEELAVVSKNYEGSRFQLSNIEFNRHGIENMRSKIIRTDSEPYDWAFWKDTLYVISLDLSLKVYNASGILIGETSPIIALGVALGGIHFLEVQSGEVFVVVLSKVSCLIVFDVSNPTLPVNVPLTNPICFRPGFLVCNNPGRYCAVSDDSYGLRYVDFGDSTISISSDARASITTLGNFGNGATNDRIMFISSGYGSSTYLEIFERESGKRIACTDCIPSSENLIPGSCGSNLFIFGIDESISFQTIDYNYTSYVSVMKIDERGIQTLGKYSFRSTLARVKKNFCNAASIYGTSSINSAVCSYPYMFYFVECAGIADSVTENYLQVVDVTNIWNIKEVSFTKIEMKTTGGGMKYSLVGDKLTVLFPNFLDNFASTLSKIYVIDVSDPSNPSVLDRYNLTSSRMLACGGGGLELSIGNNLVYATVHNGMRVLKIGGRIEEVDFVPGCFLQVGANGPYVILVEASLGIAVYKHGDLSLTGKPGKNDCGEHTIQVSASDSEGYVDTTFKLTVTCPVTPIGLISSIIASSFAIFLFITCCFACCFFLSSLCFLAVTLWVCYKYQRLRLEKRFGDYASYEEIHDPVEYGTDGDEFEEDVVRLDKNHIFEGFKTGLGKIFCEGVVLGRTKRWKVFEGEFLNLKKNGFGEKYYMDEKLEYKGNYIDDKRCGQGTEYYRNPKGTRKYQGQWKDGKWNGQGIEYDESNPLKVKNRGIWKNGKLRVPIFEEEDEDLEIVDFADIFKKNKKRKELGDGAYAKVWEVKHNGKSYAAKVFKDLKMDDETERVVFETLERNLKICVSLEHDNVLKVYGYSPGSIEKGFRGYLCEICKWSVHDYMIHNTNVSDRWKLRVLLEFSQGMKYLHSRNVMHRDLKWKNVLLTKIGQVKIADFGTISRDETLFRESFPPDDFAGTSCYQAPEVSLGELGTPTMKYDVFSFGIMLFELVFEKIGDPYGIGAKNATCTCEESVVNYRNLLSHVAKCKLRPRIPHSIEKEIWVMKLVVLMENCWDEDEEERPTFEEIVTELESLEI